MKTKYKGTKLKPGQERRLNLKWNMSFLARYPKRQHQLAIQKRGGCQVTKEALTKIEKTRKVTKEIEIEVDHMQMYLFENLVIEDDGRFN